MIVNVNAERLMWASALAVLLGMLGGALVRAGTATPAGDEFLVFLAHEVRHSDVNGFVDKTLKDDKKNAAVSEAIELAKRRWCERRDFGKKLLEWDR